MYRGVGKKREGEFLYASLHNLYYLESSFTYSLPCDLRGNPMKHLLEMRKLSLESLHDTISYSPQSNRDSAVDPIAQVRLKGLFYNSVTNPRNA